MRFVSSCKSFDRKEDFCHEADGFLHVRTLNSRFRFRLCKDVVGCLAACPLGSSKFGRGNLHLSIQ
jgi:hypothetical protein